jgi:hypothetical protein
LASTELVPSVVHPTTGEIIALDSSDRMLVAYLDDVAAYERQLEEWRRIVNRELIARLDRSAKWTRQVGPYKLTAPSPNPGLDWDGAELREALLPFVDRGELSIEALDAAVEMLVTYRPKKAGINALVKLGGDITATVMELANPKPKGDRRVRIERPLR